MLRIIKVVIGRGASGDDEGLKAGISASVETLETVRQQRKQSGDDSGGQLEDLGFVGGFDSSFSSDKKPCFTVIRDDLIIATSLYIKK